MVSPDEPSRAQRLAQLVTGPMASWAGVVFWLAVVVAAIPFATRLGSVETSRLTEFLPSGAPSTQALLLDRAFPSGRSLQADIVFSRTSGLTPGDLQAARSAGAVVATHLVGAVGIPSAPLVAPDRKVAVTTVA